MEEASTARRRKRKSPKGPGDSITTFARDPRVDQTPAIIRRAVKEGLIKAVDWCGTQRIPPSEKERYLATWGKSGPAVAQTQPAASTAPAAHEDQPVA